MTAARFFEELAYPFRQLLVPMVFFGALLLLSAYAGMLGLWLAIVIVPTYFRFLVLVAEARAYRRDPEPPGIEMFSYMGNLWSLFPVVPIVLFGLGVFSVSAYGGIAVAAVVLLMLLVFPAMMMVLVITHSPLQAMNPAALLRLVSELGWRYLLAPLAGILLLTITLLDGVLHAWLLWFASMFAIASFYCVIGALLYDTGLLAEIDISDAWDPDDDDPAIVAAQREKRRTAILNHAYGLMSRGNRKGGLEHIRTWLQSDDDSGWDWFLEQMLKWEQKDHALFFAQEYLSRLLASGENTRATKLILRAQLINERFRPLHDDRELAIGAAEATGNQELAERLRGL